MGPPLFKVSSFASESDKEMNWKVLMRIKNICLLQDKLKSLLTGMCTCTFVLYSMKILWRKLIFAICECIKNTKI